MFDIIKKLLFSRQISFEKGEIKLLGQRIVMMPSQLYVELYKKLKEKTEESDDIIKEVAESVGIIFSKKLKEKYSMKPQDIAKWDMNIIELAGLGEGKIIRFDLKNRRAAITLKNSPIAISLKPTKSPVDFYMAGLIKGASKIMFLSEKMECEEVKCEAMGNSYCEFDVYEKKS